MRNAAGPLPECESGTRRQLNGKDSAAYVEQDIVVTIFPAGLCRVISVCAQLYGENLLWVAT
jgi:hypothetical protein